MSHSLRSAWIEIATDDTSPQGNLVALLTECVDRNYKNIESLTGAPRSHSLRSAWIEISSASFVTCTFDKSHSLRSAWIEITVYPLMFELNSVALLTECVDRNRSSVVKGSLDMCRTPYGVRG